MERDSLSFHQFKAETELAAFPMTKRNQSPRKGVREQ